MVGVVDAEHAVFYATLVNRRSMLHPCVEPLSHYYFCNHKTTSKFQTGETFLRQLCPATCNSVEPVKTQIV